MEKSKYFYRTFFRTEVLQEALEKFEKIVSQDDIDTENGYKFTCLKVQVGDVTWSHESLGEFFSDYKNASHVQFEVSSKEISAQIVMSLIFSRNTSTFSVEAPDRNSIEEIFDIFDRNAENCALKEPEDKKSKGNENPTIFIGHGHNPIWKELKDHLQDKHGFPVEAYETGARAGHTIRDILQEMMDVSSFALLVFTGDDEHADGTFHARQNVIHEAGLFQGKLGFSRAIVLLEEGVEEISNIAGIQQIRFSKGNVKEVFGDVLATVGREFGSKF